MIWSHGLFYRVTGHFAVSASVISFLINPFLFFFFVLTLFWRGFFFSFLFYFGRKKWIGVQAMFCFYISFSKALLYHLLVYNVWFD